MPELKLTSYEESRLEYFREQKARCERSLDYWVKALRKGKRGYDQIMLEDKCAEYGQMMNYYDDAIKAFETAQVVDAEPVRHGKNVTATDPHDMFVCSDCGFSCEITELRYDECTDIT